MNCRPCLYVFLVFGGAILLVGLLIFSLGFIKLTIRAQRPENEIEVFRPINAGGILNEFFNQNAFFILICGLLAIILSLFLLVPGYLCLTHSDRSKRRRQAKQDVESGQVGASPTHQHEVTAVTVEVTAARSTDPLLAGSAPVAVETGPNGFPKAVPEDDDDFSERTPLTEKERFETRAYAGGSDGHPVYDVPEVDEHNLHENPTYHMRQEEKLQQHATEQHSYHSYQTSGGLGPVAPVPALAVHRVVEEDEGEEEEEEDKTANEAEDPPFANEGYVYASVKRTDRHSRSPSDESAKEVGAEVPSRPNEEGRSALLQKAHDLVDEVIRAASVDNNQPRTSANFTHVESQEDPYDETCDSPIPSVHEEDEVPDEEAEEAADHRSVTSSEEGVACFNEPAPEPVPVVYGNAIQEEEEEEEEEEFEPHVEEPEEPPPAEEEDEDEAIEVTDNMGHEVDLLADVGAPPPPIHHEVEEREEEEEDEGVSEDLMCAAEREREEDPGPPVEEEHKFENDFNGNEAEPVPPPPAGLDFGFDLPPAAAQEPEEEKEEEEEAESEPEESSQMFEAPPQAEDLNANMASGLVHISPEDDKEIGELLDPRVLQPELQASEEEEEEEEETAPPPPPPAPLDEPIIDFEEPPYKEAEFATPAPEEVQEEEEEESFPAMEPQPSLMEDLGLMDSPAKVPPAPTDGFASDLVNFDEPEASYTPPPPPPPPPPALEEEGGPLDDWNSHI